MMPTARQPERERGALLFVYAAVTSLAIVGAAAASYALTESLAAQRAFHRAQAFYAAEAGLDQALVAFRNDYKYGGAAYTPLPNTALGGYTITVSDLGHDQRRVTSTGHTPTNDPSAVWHTAQTVEAVVTVPTPLYANAIFAQRQASLSHACRVDSYNSALGPYDAASAGGRGDVGTNGTQAGAITLTEGAAVQGDVRVGPGANLNTAVSVGEGSSITGAINAQVSARVLPPVTIPPGLTRSGILSGGTSGSVVLPGGTYWFDRWWMSPGQRFEFTGPTTLYLSAPAGFAIGGNGYAQIVTADNRPENLTIYVVNGNVRLGPAGDFHGTIYAPNSVVEVWTGSHVGGPELYGAVHGALVGKEVFLNRNLGGTYSVGGGVHYDEHLAGMSGGQVRLDLWRLNPS